MKKLAIASFVLCTLAVLAAATQAHAEAPRRVINDKWALRFARTRPWNGNYYYTAWGTPVALVVPPTSQMQVKWGWGVAQSEMLPIYHQYRRPYPGFFQGGGGSQTWPTPHWPGHTDQFGVYYIRGPW